jgi:hypothetical protein
MHTLLTNANMQNDDDHNRLYVIFPLSTRVRRFPSMPLLQASRLHAIGDALYIGVVADVLWSDALPDANPTFS